MAKWVKCTRISDDSPVYINLNAVSWLRRNEREQFTVISFDARVKDNLIRVSEEPVEIFAGPRAKPAPKEKARMSGWFPGEGRGGHTVTGASFAPSPPARATARAASLS